MHKKRIVILLGENAFASKKAEYLCRGAIKVEKCLQKNSY